MPEWFSSTSLILASALIILQIILAILNLKEFKKKKDALPKNQKNPKEKKTIIPSVLWILIFIFLAPVVVTQYYNLKNTDSELKEKIQDITSQLKKISVLEGKLKSKRVEILFRNLTLKHNETVSVGEGDLMMTFNGDTFSSHFGEITFSGVDLENGTQGYVPRKNALPGRFFNIPASGNNYRINVLYHKVNEKDRKSKDCIIELVRYL